MFANLFKTSSGFKHVLNENLFHSFVIVNCVLIKRFEIIIDLNQRLVFSKLDLLNRCSNEIFISVNMKNRNSDGLVNETFHDRNIQLTCLKSIKGYRSSTLIEQIIAFILNLVWSHLWSIQISFHKIMLILVDLSLSKNCRIIILNNSLSFLKQFVLFEKLLNNFEIWIAHVMVLFEKFVGFSEVFPSSYLKEKTKI